MKNMKAQEKKEKEKNKITVRDLKPGRILKAVCHRTHAVPFATATQAGCLPPLSKTASWFSKEKSGTAVLSRGALFCVSHWP